MNSTNIPHELAELIADHYRKADFNAVSPSVDAGYPLEDE